MRLVIDNVGRQGRHKPTTEAEFHLGMYPSKDNAVDAAKKMGIKLHEGSKEDLESLEADEKKGHKKKK
jgi:hypothetical protein